ncbi:D-arabinose 5-phosphate isomerase, partial [Vibrio sp. 03_296]
MTLSFDYRAVAKQVLATEIRGLEQLSQYFDEQFEQACELILNNAGKVVVMGMGKSGHIGKKIAASLASDRHSSVSLFDPGEASHGDLGMIERG